MTQPSVHTTNIPNTSATYDRHWALTSERVYELWRLLTQDAMPSPMVAEDGTPIPEAELPSAPGGTTWYFMNYMRNIIEELRLTRMELRQATQGDVARDEAVVTEVKQAITTVLLSAVPDMARQISEQVEQLDPAEVGPVMEAAIRRVLGGLDNLGPVTIGDEPPHVWVQDS